MNTTRERLKEILEKIKETKIGIYGDFCLDAYWILDPRGSEISLETGLKASAVVEQHYSLGGASNVAANLSALNPKEIRAFGIYGNDVFGKEMITQLNGINVNTDGMIIQTDNFDTYTFSKLLLNGKEQPRIDFGTYNKRSKEVDNKLIKAINKAVAKVDIFILNQQVPNSITNPEFIKNLNKIIKDNAEKIFVLDSRHFADKFQNVSYKVNKLEAAKLCGVSLKENTIYDKLELEYIAQKLFNKTNKPVFITRGENGILAFDNSGFNSVEGIKLDTELDIVGAGDTVLSALACTLGAGCNIQESIELANIAAAVTVQKLHTTGTANEKEILALFGKID